MTPAEIIKAVAQRHRIPVKLLTGPERWTELMAPRAELIRELSAASLSPTAIAKAMNRDRGSVLYWLIPGRREQKNARYRARREALGLTGTAALMFKTTPEQRNLLVALYLDKSRRAEMLGMQEALGLCRTYANNLAFKRRMRPAPPKSKTRAPTAERSDRPQPALGKPRHTAPVTDGRTLTAALFGDPPPGRSALDLRNQEAHV